MPSFPPKDVEELLLSIMDDQERVTLAQTGQVGFVHVPDIGGSAWSVKVVKEPNWIRVEAHPVRGREP
jgi:hypothetical protein